MLQSQTVSKGAGANSGPERKPVSRSTALEITDRFVRRHIGPRPAEIQAMAEELGCRNLEELISATVPESIRTRRPLDLPKGRSEFELLAELRAIASKNQVFRSFIGMGYSDCITPPVILRNVLENPGWYTQYTPYQAEIAQGRLEALLIFQTMISELTGLEIANASLLDEATAAAEAMTLCHSAAEQGRNKFFVSAGCHPQTIAVMTTRAKPLGIEIVVGDHPTFEFSREFFGAALQYPATDGTIFDFADFTKRAHDAGILVTVAADLLSLTLLRPPGEFGADVAVGNTQRFGVPLGYGGPHAAYLATRDKFKRQMPGRLVGVSKDARGRPAYRLSLQTREQHIRRERATSNICTAQVLLAVIAGMYAVYHGPDGLKAIAQRVHRLARTLARGLTRLGFQVTAAPFFDTIKVSAELAQIEAILQSAEAHRVNLRKLDKNSITIALDEATLESEIDLLLRVFNGGVEPGFAAADVLEGNDSAWPASLRRQTVFLAEPVFNRFHSETDMLRYLRRLESRDLSLTNSMIPLGSCTMKLNAAAEMIPVTWAEFGRLHPFVPTAQTEGYQIIFRQLEKWLAEITGFAAVSLQPNAGSQGEYTGLLAIRAHHGARGQGQRKVCLIPQSAHGTNPASAVMAGFTVVPVGCDNQGNIDLDDLKRKAAEHAEDLAVLMVTYPSTHGVYEEGIKNICAEVHARGGQVYMDGANLNAQVGLCRPAELGADVCHINLHKTFCIPHGGGGPGMGPICVAPHLAGFLPNHPVVGQGDRSLGAVSAAPWGSPSILPISWAYIALMGGEGLTEATKIAILNANYVAHRLDKFFPVLYKGKNGRVAHECILDLRRFKKTTVEDVAKRLMDYGFHAPTVSWPVPGTMMIEPTESESKAELDRFCDALIAICQEMEAVEAGQTDAQNNLLKNAPHTADVLAEENWNRPYTREQAVFPKPWLRDHKFWPAVARIDNPYGDRNLVCTCASLTID